MAMMAAMTSGVTTIGMDEQLAALTGFRPHDRVVVEWDCPIQPSHGIVLTITRRWVDVELEDPQASLKGIQRFTLRKDGSWIAARYNWVWGIPRLRNLTQ